MRSAGISGSMSTMKNGKLSALLSEATISFSRSSGPGGQNVNKVATKAQLFWEVEATGLYAEEERRKIKNAARDAGYLTGTGKIVISSQESRSQEANKESVIAKLASLIARALRPVKKRRKTRVPRSAREERLKSKKIRSKIKTSRRFID